MIELSIAIYDGLNFLLTRIGFKYAKGIHKFLVKSIYKQRDGQNIHVFPRFYELDP